MIDILENVRRMIEKDKTAKNIKVRNVKTLEVFTVGDLKAQIALGKFDGDEWNG